jgi:CRP-like cAMP-binding protein
LLALASFAGVKMAKRSTPASHNVVLGTATELELGRQGFERISLDVGARLVQLGDISTHVYFPVEGVISIVSSTDRGQSVEVAAVGREGVAGGLGAAVSERSPVDLIVQVPGIAFRLDSRALRTRIDQSSPFRTRWLEHLHTLVAQIAQTAVCNRYHTAPRRLARWLLTVADRAETETIPLTHEFAAILVGGDRPRVSVALRSLRERRLVEHRRGQLRILDRQGLTRAACECYLRIATASST